MSTVRREIIRARDAPAAIGPYSQAVRVGDTLYISGALGLKTNGTMVEGGVEAETHQALKNIGHILEAAGVGFGHVVKCTVLLANIGDFNTVNEVYKQYFTDRYPARAAYQVAALPKNGLVEIEAVAVVGDIKEVN